MRNNEELQEEIINNVRIINGDSISLLKNYSEYNLSAEVVITDPPYNYENGFLQQNWDNIGDKKEYEKWCEEWLSSCYKLLPSDGVVIVFGSNHTHHRLMNGMVDAGFTIQHVFKWCFGSGLPKSPRLKTWLNEEELIKKWGDWRGTLKPAVEFAIIGTKNNTSRLTENKIQLEQVNKNIRFDQELIPEPVIIGDTKTSSESTKFFYESKASKSEKTHGKEIEIEHDTVKPVKLMEKLIRLCTVEGETVLDPFAGTGTTGIAAQNADRESVCIEFDNNYYNTSIKRNRLAYENNLSTELSDFTEEDSNNNYKIIDNKKEVMGEVTQVPEEVKEKINKVDKKVGGIIGTAVPRVDGNITPEQYKEWCNSWVKDIEKILLPGGHLAFFTGETSRHVLTSVLEDNGFEIRDVITYLYENNKNIYDEPCILARNKLDGTAVNNQVKHNVGNLNIEESRIPVDNIDTESLVSGSELNLDPGVSGEGRYPANMIIDPVVSNILDLQSGISKSTGGRAYQNTNNMYSGGWDEEEGVGEDPGYGDEGGASRYFLTVHSPESISKTKVCGDKISIKNDELYDWFESLLLPQDVPSFYPFNL